MVPNEDHLSCSVSSKSIKAYLLHGSVLAGLKSNLILHKVGKFAVNVDAGKPARVICGQFTGSCFNA